MSQLLDAEFDGEVFRPIGPVTIEPRTKVNLVVTVKDADQGPTQSASFLQVAKSLRLSGPEDWSSRVDEYLLNQIEADGAQ